MAIRFPAMTGSMASVVRRGVRPDAPVMERSPRDIVMGDFRICVLCNLDWHMNTAMIAPAILPF